MTMTTYRPGERVIWLQQARGSAGDLPVAVVIRVRKRVLIEAPLRNGGTKQVWVHPASLRPAPPRAVTP